MTIAAQLSADLRAKASYMPPCALCSHIGVEGYPDQITSPRLREFRGEWKIDHCCALSRTEHIFETAADAAAWWRVKRKETLPNVANDARRRSTLKKLALKSLEPIDSTPTPTNETATDL